MSCHAPALHPVPCTPRLCGMHLMPSNPRRQPPSPGWYALRCGAGRCGRLCCRGRPGCSHCRRCLLSCTSQQLGQHIGLLLRHGLHWLLWLHRHCSWCCRGWDRRLHRGGPASQGHKHQGLSAPSSAAPFTQAGNKITFRGQECQNPHQMLHHSLVEEPLQRVLAGRRSPRLARWPGCSRRSPIVR